MNQIEIRGHACKIVELFLLVTLDNGIADKIFHDKGYSTQDAKAIKAELVKIAQKYGNIAEKCRDTLNGM